MKNKPTTSITAPALEDLLWAFRRKIMEQMRKDDVSCELTMSQFEVLRLIRIEKIQTMKAIAQALSITPPSATALIEEMEKKGFISRSKDSHDRRIVCIELTQKAQDLFSRVCARKKAVINQMLTKLSPPDKKALERIIGIIISH